MNLEREIEICNKHEKKGYCYWGVCRFCGVPQMLRKLKRGEIEHDEEKMQRFKKFMEGRK